jgi:hypothetical protein
LTREKIGLAQFSVRTLRKFPFDGRLKRNSLWVRTGVCFDSFNSFDDAVALAKDAVA